MANKKISQLDRVTTHTADDLVALQRKLAQESNAAGKNKTFSVALNKFAVSSAMIFFLSFSFVTQQQCS